MQRRPVGSPDSPLPAAHAEGAPVTCLAVLGPVRVHREGLAHALDGRDGLRVLGSAATLDEVLSRRADRLRPDVVVVDVSTRAGLDALYAVAAAPLRGRMVAVAAPEDDGVIVACAAAGVSGFLAREGSLDELLATIGAVARGEASCSPRVTATLLRRVGAAARDNPSAPDRARLTPRERQVLDLIDDGLSNKEIATRLFIELSTVKNHVHNILAKVGAHRRSEAAAYVRRRRERIPGPR